MNPGFWKRLAGFLIKISLSVGIILWLIEEGRLNLFLINNIGLSARCSLLLLTGLASVFCGLLLLGLRLLMLLHFKGFLISFKTSFAITLIGSFWTVVLPGLAGGDVVKAGYLFVNVSERRADAISVVLIDRILGVFSLFLLGAMAASAAWAFGYVLVDSMVLMISPAAVISLTMVAFLVSGRWFSNLRIVKAGYSGLPGKVGNLVSSLRDYLRCPKLMLLAIVVSIANHALVLTTFIVAGLLIGDGIAVAMHYILDPLAMTMNMVPLTPGGVGIAEGAFSVLYKMVGSADGAAVGLLGRFIQYAVFVISGSVALCLLRVRFRIPALKKHEVTGIGSEGTRIP